MMKVLGVIGLCMALASLCVVLLALRLYVRPRKRVEVDPESGSVFIWRDE